MNINEILLELVKQGGTDLHLKASRPPVMRIRGKLLPSHLGILSERDIESLITEILDKKAFEIFQKKRQINFCYEIEKVARFRINAFFQQESIALAIKKLPVEIPEIDQLYLPAVLKDIAAKRQGLVLITGPSGSGKSTTLAAIIQYINKTRHAHIVMLEDPIEYLFEDVLCLVNQRELGKDVLFLGDGIQSAIHQDPDIISVGEIKDARTMMLALNAVETGHLVIGTMVTYDVQNTIQRAIDMCLGEGYKSIRSCLALNLVGIISQRLLKRADSNGNIAALEIMVKTPKIRKIVEEGDLQTILEAIKTAGSYYRMQTFNQALVSLYLKNLIAYEEALANTRSSEELQGLLKEIPANTRVFQSNVKAKLKEKVFTRRISKKSNFRI